jgi:hypothetical protein
MTTEEMTRPLVDELRERAVARLKKRSDFHVHLLMYLSVNAFLTTIWLLTSSHGFFWPAFIMFGWGIGLVANAWDVYRDDTLTEERIQREMDKLQRR